MARSFLSLLLSLLGLALFFVLIGRMAPGAVVLLTVGATVAGLISTVIGLSVLRSLRRHRSQFTARPFAILTIAAALGCDLVSAILLLNVLVYWLRVS